MSSVLKEVWAHPKAHDPLELTRLYRTIENGLGHRPGSSCAITGARDDEQVLRLAYDLAWVGSTMLGKRILVLDTTGQAYSPPVIRSWTPPEGAPPSDPAAAPPSPQAATAVLDVENVLSEPNRTGLLSLSVSGAAVTPQLNAIWGKLKSSFDLIVVAAPPVLSDPTASCLGDVVDGTVLVVASGRSRQKEVSRAIELLTSGSTPLLGVVMTDRRPPVPNWLRRLFGRA